jgi:hypothetical protein
VPPGSYRGGMARYIHKQRKNLAGEPLVGGEPAHHILRIVRAFPLSVTHAGGVDIAITAKGADRAMFDRAYSWIEMELLADEEKCPGKAAHATVDAATYRYIVLNELMFWAYFALEEFPDDALWGPRPRVNLFGPSLPQQCIIHDAGHS